MHKPIISVIVPTLNEEKNIGYLLKSLEKQTFSNFEVIVVDGGSKDNTLKEVAKYPLNITIIVLDDAREFFSRDYGAKSAKGSILVNTCADVTFPPDLLEKVYERFEKNKKMIALSGIYIPYDTSLIGRLLYRLYNAYRFILAKLGYYFLAGTNFHALRKDFFKKLGGFGGENIRADGLMLRKIVDIYGYGNKKIKFFSDMCVLISTRRMKKKGMRGFIRHYIYIWEALVPSPIYWNPTWRSIMQMVYSEAERTHRKLHAEI